MRHEYNATPSLPLESAQVGDENVGRVWFETNTAVKAAGQPLMAWSKKLELTRPC